MTEIKRVLISVSDKSGIAEFAKSLAGFGAEIISTGGTAKLLKESGCEVKEIGEYTGFPEMLEGRVKTLHPKIHAGLLARKNSPEHLEQLEKHGIPLIDMVVVNLYPFEQTIAGGAASLEDAIENIDIGGPTMIRAAAKNHESVAVIVNPGRYRAIMDEMKKTGGRVSPGTMKELAAEVFSHTAYYDAVISNYLLENFKPEDRFPAEITIPCRKHQELRYGENPHQEAGFYRPGYPLPPAFEQLGGKELSFNNFLDLDSAFSIVCEFDSPAAAIIKHTNPCGAACAGSLEEAYALAYECDPVSAFGSVVGFNGEVEEKLAGKILESPFVEAVIAPGFSEGALGLLAGKKNMRLIKTPTAKSPSRDLKKVAWGILLQDKDIRDVEAKSLEVVTKKKPSDEEFKSLLFAWKIAKHVKSNSIVLVQGARTVGVGAGQMSRLDSVILACRKAGGACAGAVMGSDAFFPFPDGIEEAAGHGIRAVIQPGGSLKDREVITSCDKLGLSMVLTGMRHFKH